MIESVKRVFERLKWRLKRTGEAVQSAAVKVLLVFLYVIGFGITKLVALVFARRYLELYDQGPSRDSYWKKAEGYEPDGKDLLKQV